MKKLIYPLILILTLFGCRFATQSPKSELIVSISFDDHCLSVYENALPIMAQYAFRGTVFTNTGFVGRPDKLSWAQLDSLKHVYNWEIGGHTLNHEMLSQLTYQQAEFSIATDYNNLVAHNLNPQSFATTYGYCPTEYYALINKYYKNIRTCFYTPMYCPIDRTLVGSFGVSNTMSAQDVISRINQGLVEKQNLIVLLFHEVGTANSSYLNNCHPQVFAKIMRRLHSMGVKVLPLDEALDYLSD